MIENNKENRIKAIELWEKDFGCPDYVDMEVLLEYYEYVKGKRIEEKLKSNELYGKFAVNKECRGIFKFSSLVDNPRYDISNQTNNIEKWAIERSLHMADFHKQALKLSEEVGELSSGILKDDFEKTIDAIGDIYVVLVILCQQLDLNIDACIQHAYNQIKDRKGKLVNGTFIKEDDLKK